MFGLFFKATIILCVAGQAICFFPTVSLSSECFGLFWVVIKRMMDSVQLIVIGGGGGGEYNGYVD